MSVEIIAPTDFLHDLEEMLPSESIVGREMVEGLEMGGIPWISVDPETLRNFAGLIAERLVRFFSARPKADIRIGDVSLTLENVSEQSINAAIDKAIEATRRRGDRVR